MRIDVKKMDIALARECMSISDLRKHRVHPLTLTKIRSDQNYQPSTKTIGKIAAALSVDPAEIVQED